jgi:hypothetical protein
MAYYRSVMRAQNTDDKQVQHQSILTDDNYDLEGFQWINVGNDRKRLIYL